MALKENPQYLDYQRAKELIAEGERTVAQISDIKDNRAMQRRVLADLERTGTTEVKFGYADEIARLTERMDELGKKASGIWAQAQVHATLAQTPNWVLSSGWTPTTERKFGTEYLTAGKPLTEGGTK